MARITLLGTGMRAKRIADGRCVKTIVLINPIRFDIEAAMRFDTEAKMFVTKKRVPSWPSGRPNFRVKK